MFNLFSMLLLSPRKQERFILFVSVQNTNIKFTGIKEALYKSEPLLGQSVVFAIFSSISTFMLGKYYGVIGVTGGYLALGLTIGIPWVIIVFSQKRKLWHQITI